MNFALKIVGRTISIFCLYLTVFFSTTPAHPMPNAEIAIRLDETIVTLEIKIPVPEHILAYPKSDAITAENITFESRQSFSARL